MQRWVGYSTRVAAADVLTSYIETVNVSSNSWGRTFELGRFVADSYTTQDALRTLALRGAIAVFASGNSDREWARCSHADLTAGPYLIQVAAVNDNGKKSLYSSQCAAVFISAPSGDSNSSRLGIPTATTQGKCRENFSGTSAACPTVSGVVALMKQANPRLSYRDVQWIFINNSDPVDSADSSWTTNGAGYRHSDKYGFGKLNAKKSISAAANWTLLDTSALSTSTELTSSNQFWRSPNVFIPDNTGAIVTDFMNISGFVPGARIEHIGIYIKSDHLYKNQLELNLTSPAGTEARFLLPWATTTRYEADGTNGKACTHKFFSAAFFLRS